MSDTVSAFRASPEQLVAAARCAAQAGEHPYWSVLELRLAEPLSPEQLEARLRALFEREELLHTTLQQLPGLSEPAQVIEPLGVETLTAQPVELARHALQRAPSPSGARQLLAAVRDGVVLQLRGPSTHLDLPSLWRIARELLGDAGPCQPLQHADYAEWKHAALAESVAAAPVVSPQLGLEHGIPGPRFAPETSELELPEPLWRRVSELAGAGDAGVGALLGAAYVALLQRHSGHAEVCISWQDAQLSAALAEATGPYAQPLPLRLELTPATSLRELAARLESAAAEAAAQRDAHAPGADLDYAFAYHAHALPPGGALAEAYSVSERFKLRLRVLHCEGRPRLLLDFDPGVLDRAALSLLCEQYLALLGSVCAAEPCAIAQVPLTGPLQAELLARNQRPLPEAALCVFERVQQHARTTPAARAVVDVHGVLTYAELDRQAEQLALLMAANGVVAGDVVGLLLSRTRRMLVAILAAHKLGAAYLPLDPAYPHERLAFMLRDSAARCVLSERALEVLCQSLPAAAEPLFLDGEGQPAPHGSLQPVAADAERLAYLIYTSGSSGQPKAVEITQRSLALSTEARRCFYGERVETFLLLPSFSFDSSVAGVFWTLSDGGCLVIASEAELRDPAAIAQLCKLHSVTHGLSLPSVYAALVSLPELARNATLRTWIVAGESCSRQLVQAHHARVPRVALYNEYGPTEGTVWATAESLTAAEPETAPVSIGRPIPGMRLWLVNEAGALCGVGEPGEIVLSGPLLARGYRGRPEQTAERFAVLPAVGERAYRTADRARFGSDGRLYYLGRCDRQVKVRGQRVELGEIERQLLLEPAVSEAVVTAHLEGAIMRLYAYVQGADGTREAELLAQLSTRLPAHMLPARICCLAELPRTPNGKVDVAALPTPSAPTGRAAYEPPTNERERELAELMQELLRAERVGANDDFFALGGDSITSLQLCARAAQRGLALRVRDVFEHKTVRALAAVSESTAADALRHVGNVSIGVELRGALDRARERHDLSFEELACLLFARVLELPEERALVLETQLPSRDGTLQSYQRRLQLPAAELPGPRQLEELRRSLRALELEEAGALGLGLRLVDGATGVPEPARPASAAAWLTLTLTSATSALDAWGAFDPQLAAALPERLGLALTALEAELAEHAAERSVADQFPSSGLDADGLADLLASLDA